MWCSNCRQDVPAIPVPGRPARYCIRCGQAISLPDAEPSGQEPLPKGGSEPVSPSLATVPPPASADDWELRRTLRQARQLTESARSTLPGGRYRLDYTGGPNRSPHLDVPPGTALPEGYPRDSDVRLVEPAEPAEGSSIEGSRLLAWSIFTLSLGLLIAGGILWHLSGSSGDLWTHRWAASLLWSGQVGAIITLAVMALAGSGRAAAPARSAVHRLEHHARPNRYDKAHYRESSRRSDRSDG